VASVKPKSINCKQIALALSIQSVSMIHLLHHDSEVEGYCYYYVHRYETELGLQTLVYNTTVYKEDASVSGDYNLTVSSLQSSFSYCYQLQAVLRAVNETKYGSQTACFSVATDSAGNVIVCVSLC